MKKIYHQHNCTVFCQIVQCGSKFALDKIWDKIKHEIQKRWLDIALDHSVILMACLCKHVIWRYLERGTPILLDSIEPQWHLILEEPLFVKKSSENLTEESPRTNTVNLVQDFIVNFTGAQIPTFLSP